MNLKIFLAAGFLFFSLHSTFSMKLPGGKNVLGRTALHYAQSANAVHSLVAAGALPNAQDSDGRTPLFTAHPEAIPALLRYGADPAIRRNRDEHIILRFGIGSTPSGSKYLELERENPTLFSHRQLIRKDGILRCYKPIALMEAVLRGDTNRLEALVAHSPREDIIFHLTTLRLLACAAGHSESWLYHNCDGEVPGYDLVFEEMDALLQALEQKGDRMQSVQFHH
jgi:hypothetical protein